nr:MAG TPA: hypothetical protein [Bacteriophage sp.]
MSQKYTISKFIFAYKGSRKFKIHKLLIFNCLTQKLSKTALFHLIEKYTISPITIFLSHFT